LIGAIHRLLIHTEDNSASYFLGPVGISDPHEFIEAESKRIPFKAALSGPHMWQDAFKNWPLPPITGWRNWYKRILADNSAKPAIGTTFVLPSVWSYLWPKPPRTKIF
jgi:hypothetical protein